MLISKKYNFAFLSMQKCASSSIEAMLRPHSDIILPVNPFKHTNYRIYSKYIKPYIEEMAGIGDVETICLVREPVSWLNSWYRFRSRPALRKPSHRNHRNSTYHITFEKFVEQYMAPTPPSYANVRTQYDFVRNETGTIGIDTIFCYENIDRFIAYMSRKTGTRLKLGHSNISPRTKKIISPDLEELLRQHIPRDFELHEHATAEELTG
jgi:hypothetical protein